MENDIQNSKNEALAQIMEVTNNNELNEIRIKYLGRKGVISKYIKRMRERKSSEKKRLGVLINDAKQAISHAIEEKEDQIAVDLTGGKDWFDLTIPGKEPTVGHLHPQTIVLREIIHIFNYLGYQIADGPEVEKDHYNFEVLNFPPDHPARDAQQTMYFDTKGTKYKVGELVPRTHTSSMQGRVMEKMKPPFKVIVPGRCFRYEQVDASHGIEFWQVEGFYVDKNVSLTDLFGTINYVLKETFGEDSEIRFATTFFPFVEPGVDTYIKCTVCSGKGCSFCKKTGWSEIMPAGMIHPNVLKMSGINSKKWGGFAFAIGLSRVVTLKYHIKDLRVLHTPDLRILKQF
jgi:phenylalanyl-tRNA synthetase alpha chain